MMTVRELKRIIRDLPDEAEVVVGTRPLYTFYYNKSSARLMLSVDYRDPSVLGLENKKVEKNG